MKSKHWFMFYIWILTFVQFHAEFITLGILGSAIAAGSYYFRCKFMECCNSDEVPYNIEALRTSLSRRVFGQPMVEEIVHILRAHRDSSKYGRGNKALTLSFHGWTGSGKNHVASIIAESLFKRGMNSRFVKLYVGRHHFPNPSLVPVYKEKLIKEIEDTVRACPAALIIFDEVNEYPPGVIDVIKPMAEHYGLLNGVDYNSVVFILLSNIAGDEITEHFIKLSKLREDVEFADFEHVIRKKAIDEGGFANAAVIYSQIIDHYIPFLPLEQKHVEQCALQEFKDQGYWSKPTKEMIDEVLSIITYGPPSYEMFANAGCKRTKKQVAYVLHKHRNNKNKS